MKNINKNNFWKKLSNQGRPIMVQAPMSGVTDQAFRLMLSRYKAPDVFWTEFISASALFSPKAKKYCLDALKHSNKEKPIVVQIFGANPIEIEKACKVVARLGFDGVDINMGCPDTNVEKQGAGSALIKNLKLAKEVIRSAKRGAGKLPVSVKTRIGYNKNEIEKWIPAILEENVSALTVHFRIRSQGYSPPTYWEFASQIVKLRDKISPETLIIGNGDVKSLKQAENLAKETGVDGIMIGRALIGNPWFFANKIPNKNERLNAILYHIKIFDKQKHFDSIKKHLHAYCKNFVGSKELREQLMKAKSKNKIKKIIYDFKQIKYK